MKTSTVHVPRAERGVALITGLIFMVVLTLLVIASMRTTILEEKMAGNARDVNLAFQAAEAALRAGQQVMSTAYQLPIPEGGISSYWQTTHNWAVESTASWQPPGTNAAPRYVIERISTCQGSMGFGPLNTDGVYRITARGVGGNANTTVILQAIYRDC